jgi:hypothetical protein
MKMKTLLMTLALVMAVSGSAGAEIAARAVLGAGMTAGGGQKCEMKGDGYVYVNFNATETDLAKVKPMMDTRVEEITALATEAGVTGLELNSLSYNVNSSGGDGCGAVSPGTKAFQVYGNINFRVTPADQAGGMMALLVEKGYNASFNVNLNRQCQ